jgi:hypothetical protein
VEVKPYLETASRLSSVDSVSPIIAGSRGARSGMMGLKEGDNRVGEKISAALAAAASKVLVPNPAEDLWLAKVGMVPAESVMKNRGGDETVGWSRCESVNTRGVLQRHLESNAP